MINRNIVANFYDLLDLTTYTDLCRRPKLIEEKLNITTKAATIIVIDEIQKFPKILDEVHRLIEKYKIHFLILEIRSYLSYRRKNLVLSYWRSTSQFEVDCIIGNNLACEIKSTNFVTERHLKGLKALREEQEIQKFCIISQDTEIRIIEGIQVYPWRTFLDLLWDDKLI